MTRILTWQSVDDGKDFPAICGNEIRHTSVRGHSHEFYEIVYVVDGFCLHRCNNTSSLLMAGDLLALRPGDVHNYRAQRNVDIINFMFLPRVFDGVLQEVLRLPGMGGFFSPRPMSEWGLHRHLSLQDREYVHSFMRKMHAERAEQKPGWTLRSKGLMMDFMVFFARLFEPGIRVREENMPYMGYVTAAMAKVEELYQSDLKIGTIAKELGVSADHLTRQFRQAVGMTPIDYLRRYRFARALELLRHGEAVGDVCTKVGFHHVSHFSREFKVLFGMTPSAFQRQSRERRTEEKQSTE